MKCNSQSIRRKEIYKELHPETKHGAMGGGYKGKGVRRKTEDPETGSLVSFVQDTSEKTKKRSYEAD